MFGRPAGHKEFRNQLKGIRAPSTTKNSTDASNPRSGIAASPRSGEGIGGLTENGKEVGWNVIRESLGASIRPCVVVTYISGCNATWQMSLQSVAQLELEGSDVSHRD